MADPLDLAMDGYLASQKPQQQQQQQQQRDPLDDAMDDYIRQKRQAVAGQLTQAVGVNPDQYNAKRRVAQYLGYPTAAVEALPHLENQAKVQQVQQAAAGSPALQRRYTDADFAKLAHDDAPVLAKIETAVAGAVRTLMGADNRGPSRTAADIVGDAGVVAAKGAVGLPQALVGLADIVTGGYAGKAAEAVGVRFKDAQQFLDTLYSDPQQRANAAVKEADGFVGTLGAMLTNPSTIATAVGESAPQMLGGAAIGRGLLAAAPRVAPWLAAALGEGLLGAGTSAEQSRQDNDGGLLTARQTFAAMGSGAGTALFGALGGRVAQRLGLDDIDTALVARGLTADSASAAKSGFVSAVAKSGLSEGVFEELPQSIQEQMWQNWGNGRPLSEGVGAAAAQGLLAGMAAGGGFQAVGRVAERFGALDREAADAVQREEQLKEAIAQAAQSKLADRSPEQLQAFVAEASGDATVRFDADVLMQVFNQDVQALSQALPSVDVQALQEMAATGGEVSVPMGELVAGTRGTGVEQTILEHARLGDSALSAAEAREVQGTLAQSLQQETERVIAQAQDQAAARASHDAVRDSIKAQVVATGRVRDAVAEGYATFAASFFTAYGSRMGMTAEQFYAAYPLRVLGAPSAGQQGAAPLEQSGEAPVRVLYRGTTGSDARIVGGIAEGTLFAAADESTARSYAGSSGQVEQIGVRPGAKILVEGSAEFAKLTGRKRGKLITAMRKGENLKTAADAVAEQARAAGYDAIEFTSMRDLGIAIFNEQAFTRNLYNTSAVQVGGNLPKNEAENRTSQAEKDSKSTTYGAVQVTPQTETPEQIKSATGNDGSFDAKDPSILSQGQSAPLATFNPNTLEIVLSANANLTSFFHEGGHFFLEVLADVASQPNAPAQIVEDMGTFLKWTGVQDLATWNAMTLDQQRPYHERWAESIEQYVMEGRAPSVELQPLMRRFATWLKSVYGSLKQFLASRGQVSGQGTGALDQGAGAVQPDLFPGEFATKRTTVETSQVVDSKGTRAKGGNTNSKGQQVTATKQGLQRFWDWFAGSEATDDKGRPLVLYHSTSSDITQFETNRETTNSYGILGEMTVRRAGIFLTPDLKFSQEYLRDGAGQNVMQVYAALKNPLDLRRGISERVEAELEAAGVNVRYVNNVQNAWELFDSADDGTNDFVDGLKAAGYDGAIFREDSPGGESEGGTTYVAFESNQVKSATGNRGTFDANDPSILSQDPTAQPGPPMELNDDIRRVMDRMLATDEQIAQANEVAGLVPDGAADAEAQERLRKRSIADLKWAVKARDKALSALRKSAKSIEAGIREQVVAEVEQMPEVRAAAALKGGAAPEVVADAFGYPSADALAKAIDAFGKKSDVVDGMTEQRMLEEHGDLVDERAIKDAANEAVHNEARARSLATELRTQSEMLGARADTGQTNANGSRITVNALVEAAKQFGANIVGRTPLRDLKAKAWQHTQAERRAAKRWAEATAAGKTADAVKAKQDQMLNHAAARALLDAQDESRKVIDFFKRVAKGNDEETVKKGRDADIVNAARAVLAAYGLETSTTKRAADYLEAVKANDADTYAVIAPMVEDATRNAQPLEALTFDELQGLSEHVHALWHLAKRSRQMEVDGDLIDIEDAAQDIFARLEEIGIPDTIPGEAGALTKGEERARWLQFAGALVRRVEQWTEKMDGRFGGPFNRLLFQPIKDAATRYRADHIAYRAKFQALVDNVAPAMAHTLIEAPELGYTFGRGHNGIGHAELLHAILHTGNASNKRKLLLGRRWATENADGTLDTSKWDAFIGRLASTGVLQQAHYDFAQGVWDLMESTKPLAQKTHRDVFGRYFAEVTADAFLDPFGVPRSGGYVPAQADPAIVTDASLRALAEMENESMAFSFPATSKGFTKSRVEYNRPLKLDLRTLPQHLDKVLLFSHMEPAVRGAAKLLRQKSVSQPLNRVDPSAYEGMLLPWLNRTARQQVETPIVGDGRTAKILSTLRSRSGAALMFANVSNTVQQITGLSSAAVKVGPGHLLRSAVRYLQAPKQMTRTVSEASEFMRVRMDNSVQALDDEVKAILTDPSLYERAQDWSQRHAYFLQQAFDDVLSPIVWTGAYNDALAQGMDERLAVRFADGTVRQTQGALSAEDVSRIETGPAYARMFTQFISYFNMMANTNITALQQINAEMGIPARAARASYIVIMGFLVPIWLAEAIAVSFKGGPGDADGDGDLDTLVDWLAAVLGMGTIKGLLAQVPFVGALANSAVARFNDNPADDRMSLSPAVSMLEAAAGVPSDIYKVAKGEGNARTTVRDVASLITLATGLPVTAAARPLGYLAGVADDRIEPTGLVDAAHGMVTGVPSPASKTR